MYIYIFIFLFLFLWYTSGGVKKNRYDTTFKKYYVNWYLGKNQYKEKTKNIHTGWKLSTIIAMPSQKKKKTPTELPKLKSAQYIK